ncbi:MAG: hypothetical protein MZV64_34210 [Ignavibacteriales bacterium]|nr:hypothetical protein [Ignavibacteriales bacterium]
MAREGRAEAAHDDLLGAQIVRRHQVDGPLEGGLDPPAEVLPQVAAGFADNGLADPGELPEIVHGPYLMGKSRGGQTYTFLVFRPALSKAQNV